MTESGSSLIQAAAEAERAAPPFSFFSEIEEAEKRLAESGEFTGERLFRDRPGVYAAVVRMVAEGQSISSTARALGISRNTVCAVRDREGFSVEQEKKQLLRDLRRASQLGVEKVLELLPDTKSAKDAAIVTAVMVDKQQLLSGEATSRVERVEVKPDQVKAFLDALPVVEVEELEVISTGIAPETHGQRAAAEAPALPAPDATSDIGSEDVAHRDRDGASIGTTPRATPIENTPPPRGGGGPVADSPHSGVMDTEKQNFGQRAICSASESDDAHRGSVGEPGNQAHAAERGAADGDLPAASPLCKRTTKKKQGGGPKRSSAKPASTKAPTTKKRKGGSAS